MGLRRGYGQTRFLLPSYATLSLILPFKKLLNLKPQAYPIETGGRGLVSADRFKYTLVLTSKQTLKIGGGEMSSGIYLRQDNGTEFKTLPLLTPLLQRDSPYNQLFNSHLQP